MSTGSATSGREAQRRRTRQAILAAAMELLAAGGDPSVGEIAEVAEVSRRTVYLHFPTLDQLVLDALAGMLGSPVDAALTAAPADDAHARVAALVDGLTAATVDSVALGRRLIALTAGRPAAESPVPRRGYRRVAWIESALEPVRDRLSALAFDDLVSALAVVVGWEAVIVLTDLRGLDPDQARDRCRRSALQLLDAALSPTSADG